MAEAVRRAIREGVLRPGQAIVQDDLAEQFGVSRIPLREALRIVAGEGLITMRRGQGARVTPLRLSEVEELYGLRLALEPAMAEPLIQQCRDVDVARLASMAQSMESMGASDSVGWSNVNYEFHRSMYALADRPHSLRVITQILNLVERYSRMYVHGLHSLDRVHHEHAEMIRALRSQDPHLLAANIRAHLKGARDGLRSAAELDREDSVFQHLLSAR